MYTLHGIIDVLYRVETLYQSFYQVREYFVDEKFHQWMTVIYKVLRDFRAKQTIYFVDSGSENSYFTVLEKRNKSLLSFGHMELIY
jgi:hypothetical protein